MEVIGIDFSPIMNPDDIPENLHLQVSVTNPSVVRQSKRTILARSITGSSTAQLRRSQTCPLPIARGPAPSNFAHPNKKAKNTTDEILQ
jgi:hypothetical protein